MKRSLQTGLVIWTAFLVYGTAMAEFKCFYANLHAHTGYSDGESTPDTAFAHARDIALIDIQALTDHNNYTDYSISSNEYQNTRLTADTFSVPGRFLALAGQEVGRWSSTGFGHINIYDAPELLSYDYGDLLGTYQIIDKLGHPAMFNHPVPGSNDCPNFSDLRYYPDFVQAMDLLEMVNGDYIYENEYLKALNNGWQVGASANQDNHDRNWGNRINDDGRIPLTGIWADTLTKGSILEALQARRTFAWLSHPAAGRVEVSLRSDDRWQGDHYITSSSRLSFQVRARADSVAFNRIYLFTDGKISDSLVLDDRDTVWSLTREMPSGKHYFFVKTIQADTGLAWTSPLFIDVMPYDAKAKVITWPTPVVESCQIVYPPENGATNVRAVIYDVAGNKIWENNSTNPSAALNWNSRDLKGNLVPNGLYIIKIEQSGPAQTSISTGKTAVSR